MTLLSQYVPPAAALGAAATFGTADFSGAVAGRRTPPPGVAIGVEVIGLIAIPFAFLVLPYRLDAGAALLAAAGGAAGGLGLIAFYRAMALNLVGVVAPVTAVVAAALPTVVGVVGGDRLRAAQIVGIVGGLGAIALLNAGGGHAATKGVRAALGLALLAGFGFGMFFILLHAGSSAGVVALVSGRVGAILAALSFALLSRVSPIPQQGARRLVALAGTLDGAGNVFYLYATYYGLLSVSALLASLYPAFTVMSARLVLNERLSRLQAAGAVLAIICVALIAAG